MVWYFHIKIKGKSYPTITTLPFKMYKIKNRLTLIKKILVGFKKKLKLVYESNKE